MFQTYNHLLPAEYAEAARKMGGYFTRFTNGPELCGGFAKEHGYPAMRYGPGRISLIERGRDTSTRCAAFDEFGGLQDEWTHASRHLRKEITHG
jgi:hypothetical protein